jgi:hypothetical protein
MPDSDRAEYLRRVIMARAPEIGPDDLAPIGAKSQPDLPAEIAEAVTDALAEMEERLTALEEGLRLVGDHADDGGQRTRSTGALG